MIVAEAGTFYGQAMTAGDIYTVAARAGFPGRRPTLASSRRQAVAVDSAGNVLIADGYNGSGSSRKAPARFYGQTMTAGDIYTVAGNGLTTSGSGGPAIDAQLGDPDGVAASTEGNMIIAESAVGYPAVAPPPAPSTARP